MLREQKKQCSSLHANPLFREFWHRSKPPQDAQPPVIDDLEAGMVAFQQARISAAIGTVPQLVKLCIGRMLWYKFGFDVEIQSCNPSRQASRSICRWHHACMPLMSC